MRPLSLSLSVCLRLSLFVSLSVSVSLSVCLSIVARASVPHLTKEWVGVGVGGGEKMGEGGRE